MTDQPVVMIVLLAALSLLPFVLIMLTSFVKIAVVLAITRNALGAGNIPPTMVVTGLAMVLTIFVMAPVGSRVYADIEPVLADARGASLTSAETVGAMIRAGKAAREPVRAFLATHAHRRARATFTDLARRMRPPAERAQVHDTDLLVLAPAFVVSELEEAFAIGFLIFIPFLIVDLVVANVLLSLGMHMMSPATVSLPFKLLLFVMADGWQLVTQGLALGYT